MKETTAKMKEATANMKERLKAIETANKFGWWHRRGFVETDPHDRLPSRIDSMAIIPTPDNDPAALTSALASSWCPCLPIPKPRLKTAFVTIVRRPNGFLENRPLTPTTKKKVFQEIRSGSPLSDLEFSLDQAIGLAALANGSLEPAPGQPDQTRLEHIKKREDAISKLNSEQYSWLTQEKHTAAQAGPKQHFR